MNLLQRILVSGSLFSSVFILIWSGPPIMSRHRAVLIVACVFSLAVFFIIAASKKRFVAHVLMLIAVGLLAYCVFLWAAEHQSQQAPSAADILNNMTVMPTRIPVN